jgi:glycine cleavage system H lipoate-binding protein
MLLTQTNDAAQHDPREILGDPYGNGWMVRGHALDWERDRARLLGPQAYRTWIQACMPGAFGQA